MITPVAGHGFMDKITKQVAKMKADGSEFMAKEIVEQMKENVDNGTSFDKGESFYAVEYAPRTKTDREKGGYQTSYADLQRGLKRVKSAEVRKYGRMSTIRFASGGDIMFKHNWGDESTNLPRRQLFPDVIEGSGKLVNPSSMPKKIVDDTLKFGTRLMNEPV